MFTRNRNVVKLIQTAVGENLPEVWYIYDLIRI
jgi:hypothetical protein